MTLIQRAANYRVCSCADAIVASVRLGAGVIVVASSAVSNGRIGAYTRACIAIAGKMALIQRAANYRVRSCADAIVASVRSGAGIAVVATSGVSNGRIGAYTRACITIAGDMTLIQRAASYPSAQWHPLTDAGDAYVVLRQHIAIVASSVVR